MVHIRMHDGGVSSLGTRLWGQQWSIYVCMMGGCLAWERGFGDSSGPYTYA